MRANTSLCGQFGGCPTKLITRNANDTFTDLLDGLAQDVYITNRTSGGWPVLWLWISGIDGGLLRLQFRGTRYQVTDRLRARSEMQEWTHEQMQNDTLMRLLQGVEQR